MSGDWISLSDPDITELELDAVREVLCTPSLAGGPAVEAFEEAFARALGRKHAVAVASGRLGLLLALKAHGIGEGDEVVASSFSWRETAYAVALSGAKPVFADIDYWSGALTAEKATARITSHTRAIVAGNTNGHPAPWRELRALADEYGLALIEDSTEAVGSTYDGGLAGTFGDCAVFDFSQPGPLVCGEGGMIVTDDADWAAAARRIRSGRTDARLSVVDTGGPPWQAGMSDVAAALGLTQLSRLEVILAERKLIETWYLDAVSSFEGVKPPYVAPDVGETHWLLFVVHLGTRFSRASRDAIIEDLRAERIQAAPYARPLHQQAAYVARDGRRTDLKVTEKLADRAIALPFHTHLTREQVRFIVATMKDASVNVGAGTAIYL